MVSVKKYNTMVEKYKKLHRKYEKIKHEHYQSPYMISSDSEELKDTGKPITSLITSSFEMAREKRTPYDKYWLGIYNSHSLKENYNLPL